MKRFLCSIGLLASVFAFSFTSETHAAQNYVINGSTYSFPDVDDVDWGQNVTDWAGAVTTGMLQKAGGTFTLTSDAYFGANYGLRSKYYKTGANVVASTGAVRLGNSEAITWRNLSNTTNYTLALDTGNYFVLNSTLSVPAVRFNDGTIFISTSSDSGVVSGVYSSSDTFLNIRVNQQGRIVEISTNTTATGVVAGVYGSTSSVTRLTVNAAGNVTSISTFTIAASTSNAVYNLEITTNGSNTNQFVFTADALDVQGCYATNFSTRVDLSKSGAGGSNLANPANTWHRFYAIANESCTKYGVIADSGNVLNPVLPADYTRWRTIGLGVTDNSSAIVPYYKLGRHVYFYSNRILVNRANLSTTETAVDISSVVSPLANYASYESFNIGSGVSATVILRSDHEGLRTIQSVDDTGVFGVINVVVNLQVYGQVSKPILRKSRLLYIRAAGSGTAPDYTLAILGYEEDIF